jgi:hypothetical protein
MTTNNTTNNVTFSSIATVLISLGVGLFATNVWVALLTIVLGIGSLVLREVLKSK